MGALHTTLTGALLSGTFVAGWEGSHVELEVSFKMAGGEETCVFVMVPMCANGQRATEVSIRRPCSFKHLYITI